MQELEAELGAALDDWQGIVVESCASDWHTVVEVYFMLNVAVFRELGSDDADSLIESLDGIGVLLDYYQTNATVACGLGG